MIGAVGSTSITSALRPSSPVASDSELQREVAGAENSNTTAAEPAPADAAAEDPSASPDYQREVQRLAQRDREVRAHEQAHIAVGGSLITSGPTYEYTTGPDNQRYAVGGEVGIDTSPVRGDPEATIFKAAQIRAAALAPADPSSADLQAAASATQMEQRARAELAEQRRREQAYSQTAAADDSATTEGFVAVA